MSSNSFAYWLFHAITFSRKVFSKIHESKSKKSLKSIVVCWFQRTLKQLEREQTDTQTDRQTDRQTHTTTTVTLAHARRGLTTHHSTSSTVGVSLTTPSTIPAEYLMSKSVGELNAPGVTSLGLISAAHRATHTTHISPECSGLGITQQYCCPNIASSNTWGRLG